MTRNPYQAQVDAAWCKLETKYGAQWHEHPEAMDADDRAYWRTVSELWNEADMAQFAPSRVRP